MSDRKFETAEQGQQDVDHWAMFADAMDLTIEGHRLIAQEIGYEMRLAWRALVCRMRATVGTMTRRRAAPPV